ncbi:aminoglycoside phosphotransferase family protein [Clostridiales bacterium COT073_COT-073]|nr:aminoglycoside phosphotransferase family protein [Clostridiales bacterium COT073_COT-073]
MEVQGKLKVICTDLHIYNICAKLLDESVKTIYQICERYGEKEEDIRNYDVYLLETSSGQKILKKTSVREVTNYKKYLAGKDLAVPIFYGSWKDENVNWILLEHINGQDLRDMTDESAITAADSLVKIQNQYWNHGDMERFYTYLERIEKRYHYIKEDKILARAYQIFLNRQRNCPRTLSNGDFLQFNAMIKEDKVFIIDWGFGGVMPYSLDIARFIAHATEDRATFPFYMDDYQKELFINRVYSGLHQKPEYEQYIRDIKYALFNEYIEFIEAGEDEKNWYGEQAEKLAREILKS